jgi:VWFA-related protein
LDKHKTEKIDGTESVLRERQARVFLIPIFVASLFELVAAYPAPQQTQIRTTTRLVQVNVIVRDKQGQPISDLRQGDFILLDGGKPQEISFFSVESTRPPGQPAPPLPPNTFTNRPKHQGSTQTSITVILLDGLNTRFDDQFRAKKEIVKFLEQIHPEDHIALYALASELRILHDFTTDARPLLRALARHKGTVSPELAASEPVDVTVEPGLRDEESRVDREIDDLVRSEFEKVRDFYTVRRVELTVRALESVAHHVARFPGRKNLLWVSASFPLAIGQDVSALPSRWRHTRTFSNEIDRATRALSDANVAVYPIDARGLAGVPALDASKQTVDGLDLDTGRLDKTMWYEELTSSIATMKALAQRTGGRAFWNSNDILGSIHTAVDDCRVTYMLGYYPSHNRWDGSFREIKVKLGRPGLRVQHRSGYFAHSDEALTEAERRSRLEDAALSPIQATGIGLTVRVQPVKDSGSTALRAFAIVDSRNLTLDLRDERWVGRLDVLFLQVTDDGRKVEGRFERLDLSLTHESLREIEKEGLTISQQLSLNPDASEVRVVIRDARSGSIGSVSIPLNHLR